MYEDFFGLTGKPFSLLPDAGFLYPSKRHRRIISLLEYGIITQAGFLVISGDVGSGKTTVLRHFLKNLGKDVTVGMITNPGSHGKLMSWVAIAFELGDVHEDGLKLYSRFVDFLVAEYARGKRTVLIIDEAQNLTMETLEELRMLSNVNNERDQLLQIILSGQPELLKTLKHPSLQQFVQRIAVHNRLTPLNPQEAAAYIRHRLSVVGGKPELFDDMTCAIIFLFSDGVPRLINLLCDHGLVYAFAEDKKHVDVSHILEVVLDRENSGLSAFRNVAEGLADTRLYKRLESIVHMMYHPSDNIDKDSE